MTDAAWGRVDRHGRMVTLLANNQYVRKPDVCPVCLSKRVDDNEAPEFDAPALVTNRCKCLDYGAV